jgi:hypothetical protein
MVSVTSCCGKNLEIICNIILIFAHFNKIYISAYSVVIFHFWIFVKDNENLLLGFKNTVPGEVSWPLRLTGKLFLARGKKELDHSGLNLYYRTVNDIFVGAFE